MAENLILCSFWESAAVMTVKKNDTRMAFIHWHSSGINLCGNAADFGTIQLVCYSDRGTSGNLYASSVPYNGRKTGKR